MIVERFVLNGLAEKIRTLTNPFPLNFGRQTPAGNP